MKISLKSFFLSALTISFCLELPSSVAAQVFTTLHDFTSIPFLTSGTNIDGAHPSGGLIISSNTLYGTTTYGGYWGFGAVFAVHTDGKDFTNLHSFTFSEGINPCAGLILSSNTLYGTTQNGGVDAGYGTVFAVNTDGTGFTNLHSFTAIPFAAPHANSDGAYPRSGLILSGNTLYGTTSQGGSAGWGTVFAIHTDGTGFTNLHGFTGYPNEGNFSVASLILSSNTLYGTTAYGGNADGGTIFSIKTNGAGFTNLYSFSPGALTPQAGLVLLSNALYGTVYFGGSSFNGTVFKINTDGTGFTNIYIFSAGNPNGSGYYTNRDGANPKAGLILFGKTLYGTTENIGKSSHGTVFAINIESNIFTSLYSFTAGQFLSGSYTNSDGGQPLAGLALLGSTLYGTAYQGGGSSSGTIFSLLLAPKLNIVYSGMNVVLTWETNFSGFRLESTTNLISPKIWTTISQASVVINGQNVVTNAISEVQKFYRLSQ